MKKPARKQEKVKNGRKARKYKGKRIKKGWKGTQCMVYLQDVPVANTVGYEP